MRHDAQRTRVPREVFRTLVAISSAGTNTRRQAMLLSLRTVAKLFGRRIFSDRKMYTHLYHSAVLKAGMP